MTTNRLELIPKGVDELIQKFVAHPIYRLRTEEKWIWDDYTPVSNPDEPDRNGRTKSIRERYIHIEFITGDITFTISIGGFVGYTVNGRDTTSLFKIYGENKFKQACQAKKKDVLCVIVYPNSKENHLRITTMENGIKLENLRLGNGLSSYAKIPTFATLIVPYSMQEFIYEIIEVAKTIHQSNN